MNLSVPRLVNPAARGTDAPRPSAGAGQDEDANMFAAALSAADERLAFDAGDAAPGTPDGVAQQHRDGTLAAADDRALQPGLTAGPEPGMSTAALLFGTIDPALLLAQNNLSLRPTEAEAIGGARAASESARRSTLAATAATAATSAARAGMATAEATAATAAGAFDDLTSLCSAGRSAPPIAANAAAAAGVGNTATTDPVAANAVGSLQMTDVIAPGGPRLATDARGAIGPGPTRSTVPEEKTPPAFGSAASPVSINSIPAGVETDCSAVPSDPTAAPAEPTRAASAAPPVDARAGASATAAGMTLPGTAASTPQQALPEPFAALVSEGLYRTDERRQRFDDAIASPMPTLVAHPGAAAAAAPASATAHPAAAEAANASYPALTERIVEQVGWWLAQKTQGADFSIEMPGGPPLSVSVQVRGNEAQVAFRSDQPEIRQWLGQALASLQDSFGNEGLLLSQASVSAHAAGQGPHSGDARQRHPHVPRDDAGESQQLASPAAPAAATAVRRAPSGSARGSLDLYV